ncbi:hypothetical protein [Methylobacterium oxalidis]|uniref:Uncharacterized protein n=1 Tax=Methylobacterium oxalidis TaxID=944322 RepID=A0A512J351_9HYPH|nr:hypothetical protein [Methylobacterium oxalidis]GEP04343.1 hypothetical protein MOX02_23810 [Methylobacterium oxalidis]GJE30587.1 hypothetical protein LDDCCGHA_0756 [Methylobacterium oxalidis]GLS67138.1 hypothetical protein GCM10007888_55210 [Methylobacterium oxalidis]
MAGSGRVGALDLRSRSAVREAFCALVEREGGAMALGLGPDLSETVLLAICDALADDLSVMPRGTIRAINSYVDGDRQVAFGSSFGEGAQVMRDETTRWTSGFERARSRFLQSL